MRLTFFGLSLVSSFWNGAATYYRGLLRALAARGHEIVFCEPDAWERQKHRDLRRDPEYATVRVYGDERERDALVDLGLRESDWIVKCSGVGIWDAELEEASRAPLDAHAARSGMSTPATLRRIAADPADPFGALIPRFDHVFTYGGGPPVVEAYRRFGARACTPVYNGLDPGQHHAPSLPPAEICALLFMGNRLPDRELRVHEFFFRAARLEPATAFVLGGAGWHDLRMPANVRYVGHVPTREHNWLNASARLVLNVHRVCMVENGWSPATRMFEAAGAAACQITDEWKGVEAFFEPRREILVAPDGEDVARLVRETTRKQARAIGRAARDRALRG